MARRASSSTNPILIIGIVVGIAVVVIGGKMLFGGKSASFSDVPPLSVENLMENGNSMRFNESFVEGRVNERFFRDGTENSVISIRVDASSGEEVIPVLIPSKFNDMNIEREQRYAFKVKIKQGGIPVAIDIERL